MKGLDFGRFALGGFAAATMLAGCGGSQSLIGTSGTNASLTREPPDRVGYKVLYIFDGPVSGPAPAYPYGGLAEVRGVLYGTTASGGTKRAGTVFGVTPSGSETLLYSFGSGGKFDGSEPLAGLTNVGGVLYGTTEFGGASQGMDYGTVFRITTSGSEQVVYGFKGAPDGAYPAAAIISDASGALYGTTFSGGSGSCGSEGCGTVFKVTQSGTESVLYSFAGGADGEYPQASLTEVNGELYGTTLSGGTRNNGTVFKINHSGKETVLHSFKGGSDGAKPAAGLTYVNGLLYGTTTIGGSYYYGTAFSISTSGEEKVFYRFGAGCYSSHCTDGAEPYARLKDVKGTLYGTTRYGGTDDEGTVFKITLPNTETVLYNFIGNPDGAEPLTDLLDVKGKLYGTTRNGGGQAYCVGFGCGTVFRVSP